MTQTITMIPARPKPAVQVIYRSPELDLVTNHAGARLGQCNSTEPIEFILHCGFCFSEMTFVSEAGRVECFDCGTRLINV